MPVFIDQVTSNVTSFEGELPLSPAQLEKLVELVLQRLEEKQRGAQTLREATQLRRSVAPRIAIAE